MELSEKVLERQEHLHPQRLAALTPIVSPKIYGERPSANLVDLFGWAERNFAQSLQKSDRVHPVINNRIAIEGSFFEYAETHNLTIKCLYRDSIASWKTEHDYENFIIQGVFLIQSPEVEFIQAALFHKGNQNEDEVSFFVLVDESQYYKYVELRNHYDQWLVERDRDNLEIYVVGGDGIPYTRESTWEDIFLPESLKDTIRNSVEGWLAAKEIYERAKVPWKRGILLYGDPGCGKTSIIRTIISSYNFKPVTIEMGSHTNNDTLTEAFAYAQEQSPGLLYIEDIDTLFIDGQVSLSHFLNLMDGISTKNGIFVIGTANDLDSLKESITDRPSRFDRKWEIPLPSKEMSLKYLRRWFGDLISEQRCSEFAEIAVRLNFSYVYLKELYLSSIFNALADGREKPTEDDLQLALDQLVGDKETAKKGHRTTRRGKIGI
jgi:hypothetical protein